ARARRRECLTEGTSSLMPHDSPMAPSPRQSLGETAPRVVHRCIARQERCLGLTRGSPARSGHLGRGCLRTAPPCTTQGSPTSSTYRCTQLISYVLIVYRQAETLHDTVSVDVKPAR